MSIDLNFIKQLLVGLYPYLLAIGISIFFFWDYNNSQKY